MACATGTETGTTDDVSLTEQPSDTDSGGARLPPSPAKDAAPIDESDASVTDSGAADADAAADANDSSVVDSGGTTACGAGFVQRGEYATWFGKVNLHRATGGAWLTDSDCSSGANVNTVAYCQKFWPGTTKQVQLAAVTADNKPFTSGGGTSPSCGGVAMYPGQAQFACCGP